MTIQFLQVQAVAIKNYNHFLLALNIYEKI